MSEGQGTVPGSTPESAPATAPAELQQAQTPADGAEVHEGGEGQVEEPQQPTPEHRRPQYRFSELSRQRNEAMQEAAYWRGIAEGKIAAQQPQAAPEPQHAPAEAEPNPANYPGGEYSPDFIRDHAAHVARMEARALLQSERQLAAMQAAFEEGRQRFVGVVQAVAEAGDTMTADFLQRVVGHSPREVADSITESEYAPLVAQYFARNPAEFQRIASLPVTRRAVEIDRIGSTVQQRIAMAEQRAQYQPQPTPSRQPPPPAPPQALPGRGAAPAIDPNRATLAELRQAYGFSKPRP